MGKTRILNLTALVGLVGLSPIILSSGVYADTVGSGTQEINGRLAPNSVTISAEANVEMDVVRGANPVLRVGKGTVNVNVGSSGYQLYISGANTGANNYTSLYYNGNIGSTSEIKGFAADAPATFTPANVNQWGFAVASETAGSASGYAANSLYDRALNSGTIADAATINSLTWQGVNKNYKLLRASAISGNTEIYYGIYVNSDLMSGNYKNSIVYTAFADGANKLEIYPFNVGDGNTMNISVEYQSSEFPIPDASRIGVNLRDGNTSVGTCDNIALTSNGSTNVLEFTCTVHVNANFQTGKAYDATVTVSMPNTNSELSYTAEDAWASYTEMADGVNMQDVSTLACRSAEPFSAASKTYSLIDSRDNKSYLVAKLNDGNCWMVQNLALDQGQSLTPEDSDINSNYAIPDTTAFSSNTTGDAIMPSHTNSKADSTDNTGGYYSWVAATAGANPSSGEANTSICPKGWKLPTKNDFTNMYKNYGNTFDGTFKSAWRGAFVGNYSDGSLNYSNSFGRWWTRTVVDSYSAYYANQDKDSAIFKTNYYNKRHGVSVRCISNS